MLHQELPYVPLWYEDQVYAGRREVTGYRLAPDGNYDGLVDVELGSDTAGRGSDREIFRSGRR